MLFWKFLRRIGNKGKDYYLYLGDCKDFLFKLGLYHVQVKMIWIFLIS